MSILSILSNHNSLENDIEQIIKYGLEIIDRNSQKAKLFTIHEKGIIIEGLLLRACARWESFLEIEVVSLVSMDKNKLLDELDLPANSTVNQRVIKAILFSTSYRDFHDLERSKGFFRRFITDKYNFFDKISNEQIHMSRMVYKLRNYLAHYSEFAKKQLEQEYQKTYGYSVFMTPGRFLMRKSGEHFEKLIHNFSLISSTMKGSLYKWKK